MCTVIIEIPERPGLATRVLAVRDEDPARPWDPPGEWWPAEHPGVTGVRDRLAGGAWLAASPRAGRLAVILNRPEPVMASPGHALESRGGIPLAVVDSEEMPDHPNTQSFNLVSVHGGAASVSQWDGVAVRTAPLSPGVHMLAHHEVDDQRTARIVTWLPQFRALAGLPDDAWRDEWLALLDRTAELDREDDRAIIRDNTPHGFPTQSLLVCVAAVGADEEAELEWFGPPTGPGRPTETWLAS